MENTHFKSKCDLPELLEATINTRKTYQQNAIVLDGQGFHKISDQFTILKEVTRDIEAIIRTWTEGDETDGDRNIT
jgi:hypothetical protein